MRSIAAYTEEIDDLDAAVDALLEQTSKLPLAQHSMAILFAEEDTDYPALYARLSQHWDFPVMGCTAMAMLSDTAGYCRSGISVLILTADDCTFAVGATGSLSAARYQEDIAALYRELAAQHDSEIKLVLSYYGISLDTPLLSGSNLLAALDEIAGGLPIYGGAASDNLTFSGYRVFFNDRVIQDGMVIALISGNITPRFVRVNSVENMSGFSYEITQAKGNVVYRLGNGTVLDALKKEKMRVDQENVMSLYVLSPFLVTVDHGNGDLVEVARIFSHLDLKTGAGSFLGRMPEGATVNIGLLNREDVCRSVEEAFRRMSSELRQRGESTTLLCNSCCARFLALVGDPSAEAEMFVSQLPDDVSLAGFYAYGECCPVPGKKTGKIYNMFHNFTFTILAF